MKILPFAILLSFTLSAQTPIPGKFYEYYVVAKTGATFTTLGTGPSINDAREVAFYGTTSAGNGLWYISNGLQVNFNPGESFGSSDLISQTVQINANHQVVAEDKITTTSPATTSIRLYNATSTDSFSYTARGGPSRAYDAIFPNPSVNLAGDVVFGGLHTPTRVLGYLAHGSSTIVERNITNATPAPMIADDGTVVLLNGNSTFQLLAYPPGLGAPSTIADTSTNWASLGSAPGISRDGRIIVFQGNPNAAGATAIGTTTGAGIFAAINEGAGFGSAKIMRITGTKVEDVAADQAASKGNSDGVCDTGEICKLAAELGFDASGNPISLASYGTDSRVGVANLDLGAAGIDDDSFVISFIGTPSAASKDNPAAPGNPLLFSAQKGLWTIRVDVQHQLSGGHARVYHPFTPIPVAQVGDKIGGDTITDISVYDPIANAAHDESGGIRTMRRGDHRVVFWASTSAGQIIVRGNHIDSDQDGLLDFWETTGIDMDQDGIPDLVLAPYGADPFHRDLFLQVDWVGQPGVDVFKPAGGIFSSDIAGSYSNFEANLRGAEALSGALYGARVDGSAPIDIPAGVTPHVDAGSGVDSLGLPMSINLGGGAIRGGNYVGMPGDPSTLPDVVYIGLPGLTAPGLNIRSYQSIKDAFLGTADKNARMMAFHYALFGPHQDMIPNYPSTPYSASVASAVDAYTIELTEPLSSIPQVQANQWLVVTSGSAIRSHSQIASLATSGASGNAILNLTHPITPSPAHGDGVAFLDGSTGNSEIVFAPTPDHNSLPGNDLVVSAGSMGVLVGIPANACLESQTLSHELGHTLGLRHGGVDQNAYHGNAYLSLMSYSWQLVCNPAPAQPTYSKAGDTTFDDYAHLQFDFSDVLFHLGNSFGIGRGEGYQSQMHMQAPEQTLADVVAQNGPIDAVPPSVAITSPASGGTVVPGSNLTVNVTATDNTAIGRVSVSFDVNGNGVIDAGEAVNATSIGSNHYQATFANVSGGNGARTISAIAWDTWSNTKLAAIGVNVNTPGACDVTGDNAVNVDDVLRSTSEVLGTATPTHDLNRDGHLDVRDIQIVINAAMNLGCSAQ